MMNFEVADTRRTVFKLAWPIIIHQLLMIIMLLVDTLMLGHYSTTSLAATGIAMPIIFFLRMVLLAIPIAATVMVSRAVGEKDIDKARLSAVAALIIGVVFGVIVSIFGQIFAADTIRFFTEKPELSSEATIYLKLVISVFIFNYLFMIATSICRGAGDTKTPMFIVLGGNCINIIINYLLIYGKFGFPEWGIKGAAVSTMICSFLQCLVVVIFLFTKYSFIPLKLKSFLMVKAEQFRTLFRISLPAMIEPLIVQIGMILFLKMVVRLGETSIAAHNVVFRIEAIAFMPGVALSIATATIVGQSLGARKLDSAMAGCRESNRLALLIMSMVGFIFVLIPSLLLGLFTPDINVIKIGAACLVIAGLEQPFIGYAIVHRGALQGAGDTVSPIFVSAIGVWFIRLPLVYWLTVMNGYTMFQNYALFPNDPLFYVWLTTPIDWFVRAALFRVIYQRGRWKKIKI